MLMAQPASVLVRLFGGQATYEVSKEGFPEDLAYHRASGMSH